MTTGSGFSPKPSYSRSYLIAWGRFFADIFGHRGSWFIWPFSYRGLCSDISCQHTILSRKLIFLILLRRSEDRGRRWRGGGSNTHHLMILKRVLSSQEENWRSEFSNSTTTYNIVFYVSSLTLFPLLCFFFTEPSNPPGSPPLLSTKSSPPEVGLIRLSNLVDGQSGKWRLLCTNGRVKVFSKALVGEGKQ